MWFLFLAAVQFLAVSVFPINISQTEELHRVDSGDLDLENRPSAIAWRSSFIIHDKLSRGGHAASHEASLSSRLHGRRWMGDPVIVIGSATVVTRVEARQSSQASFPAMARHSRRMARFNANSIGASAGDRLNERRMISGKELKRSYNS